MKRIILAAVLMTGISPAFAACQIGGCSPGTPPAPTASDLQERVEKLEREADARKLDADLAKPCREAVAFGCRTGDK
jgi:hypothetical protein